MKLRLILSACMGFISIVMIPSAIIFFEPYGQGVFYVVFIFIIINIVYYIYGGLAKFFTYIIYLMFTLIGFIYFDESYIGSTHFIDITNSFSNLQNLKDFYPLGYIGHVNEKGYKKIADILKESILN